MSIQQSLCRTLAAPLVAVLSAPTTYISGSTSTIGPSGPGITCTATGGSGSYTYTWTRASGDTGILATTTTANTGFTRGSCVSGTTYVAVFKCTVNDGVTSVDSGTTTVTIERS